MEEFRNELFKLINSANLPPEAIYYVCKDVFREVQDSYSIYLKRKAASEVPQVAEESPSEDAAEKED